MRIVSGKYEILEIVSSGPILTARARHTTLGHPLFLHFVQSGDTETNRGILDQLTNLPEDQQRLFIDAGEDEGLPYLVSWPLSDFKTLPDWLNKASEQRFADLKRSAPVPKMSKESRAVGDFTALYFRGVQANAGAAGTVRPLERASGASANAVNTDSFNRYFGLTPGPPKPQEAPKAPAAALGAQHTASHESLSPSTGGLTQFFHGPEPVRGSAAPQLPPAAAAAIPALDPVAPPPAPPPLYPAPVSRSGDYTVVVRPPGNTSPEPPASAPVPPGPPPAQRANPTSEYLYYWAGFGLLFLSAVAMILFFVLRR